MKFIKKYRFEILIIGLFILSRLPSLGIDTFNTDVWKWKARTFDFGSGIFSLDLDKTVQKYHPGVSLMWIGSVAVKFFGLYKDLVLVKTGYTPLTEVFALHVFQKAFVVITIGITLAFIYHALQKLFGTKYSLLAIFLIVFEPFNIALTREYHLEGLMSVFMVASFVWYYYYLHAVKDDDYQKGILIRANLALYISAFFGALSVLTKTSALILLPMIFLMDLHSKSFKFAISPSTFMDNLRAFLLNQNQKPNPSKSPLILAFGASVLWGSIFYIFICLLWPVVVTNPALVFTTLYKGIFDVGLEGEHFQLYRGIWVENPGMFYYLVVFLYRSSLYLVLGLLGYLYMITRPDFDRSRSRVYKFSIQALTFALLYFAFITFPSKKLDRYLLPSILLIAFPVAEYFNNLIHGAKWKIVLKLVVFVMPAIFTIFYLHPNYFSYYSPLFGGLKKGIFVLEPKWMFGQRELQRSLQLQQQADGIQKFSADESLDEFVSKETVKNKFTVGLQEKYYTQFWPFVEEIGGKATILDIAAHAKSSNYFVYPVWDDKAYLEDRVDLEYVTSVRVRGVEVYKIYKAQ